MLRAWVTFACSILTTVIVFREATCRAADPQNQSPNILLIVADDNHSVLHVIDIMPTLLESVGVEHPSKKQGSTVTPPQGKSMWPLLSGRSNGIRTETDWLGWELFGNRAIRQGDWKLLYLLKGAGGNDDWELFNLREDPAELNDLSAKYPNKREALLELWNEYVKRNGVIVSEAGPYAQVEP